MEDMPGAAIYRGIPGLLFELKNEVCAAGRVA
jgi:hypothetical protein